MTSLDRQRDERPSLPIPDDMPAVLEALGIEIHSVSGDDIVALCPMHVQRTGRVDNHPSWHMSASKGLHHCYSCKYSGHIVGLVADIRNTDFLRARIWLRKQGVNLDVAVSLPERPREPARAEKLRPTAPTLAPFCEPPQSALDKRAISLEAVQYYGILWHPEQRGWVLPVVEPDGPVLGYQFKRGRTVRNRPRSMEKSTTLFGIEVFKGGRAILVESPLDCAVLHTVGIHGALSPFGSSVSDTQMEMLLEYADEVTLALDNDYAGRTEMRRLVTGIRWRGAEHNQPEHGTRWSSRIRMSVWDYDDAWPKDVGDIVKLEGGRGEIYRGLRMAKHTSELGWLQRSKNSTTPTTVTGVHASSATRRTRTAGSGWTGYGRRH